MQSIFCHFLYFISMTLVENNSTSMSNRNHEFDERHISQVMTYTLWYIYCQSTNSFSIVCTAEINQFDNWKINDLSLWRLTVHFVNSDKMQFYYHIKISQKTRVPLHFETYCHFETYNLKFELSKKSSFEGSCFW